MRITFLGNDAWSVASLEALAASAHPVALVVTREPRPAGRGGTPRPTPVADAARRLGLPLAEVATVKRDPGLEALRAAAPDVLVVVAYGEILPPNVLAVPKVAPVNVHFSLLPVLRGAGPVRGAILEGHRVTGVTTMRMDEGMDTGPVLLQQEEPIDDDDDAGTLGARLAVIGGALLVRTLDGLAEGSVTERRQSDAGASIAPKLRAEDEWLDWTRPADRIWRRVRALAPDPGARTRLRDRLLKILRASPVEGGGAPGEVLDVSREGPVVAAGEDALLLREVLPEGRKRMPGADFARGARLERGERLG